MSSWLLTHLVFNITIGSRRWSSLNISSDLRGVIVELVVYIDARQPNEICAGSSLYNYRPIYMQIPPDAASISRAHVGLSSSQLFYSPKTPLGQQVPVVNEVVAHKNSLVAFVFQFLRPSSLCLATFTSGGVNDGDIVWRAKKLEASFCKNRRRLYWLPV